MQNKKRQNKNTSNIIYECKKSAHAELLSNAMKNQKNIYILNPNDVIVIYDWNKAGLDICVGEIALLSLLLITVTPASRRCLRASVCRRLQTLISSHSVMLLCDTALSVILKSCSRLVLHVWEV